MTYEANVATSSFAFSLPQFARDKSHILEIPAEDHEMLKQRQLHSCHNR